MNGFAKSAIFQPFRDHFHIVKLVQHKCQNQLVISNIKHPKPKYLLFLGVTYIHICLKQFEYPFSPKSDALYCTASIFEREKTTCFPCIILVYFTGHGFILVYSISSRQSLEELKPILELIGEVKHQNFSQTDQALKGKVQNKKIKSKPWAGDGGPQKRQDMLIIRSPNI